MRKTILTACLVIATIAAKAQTKDTTRIHTPRTQLTSLAHNLQITQQVLHKLSMDALLRDKLDSLYTNSINTLERMYGDTVKKVKSK